MQNKEYNYLNIIRFTQLVNWSSYALLGKNLIYTQKFPFVRIGEFLRRSKEQVSIQDGTLYKRPTIRMNGNGINLRDEVDGKLIGTKNQFRIYKNQFLLSKIDARNGAFGVVPDELNEGIITGNFWTFNVDYTVINPHYLTLLTRTKEFQKLSQTASVGTTNRNYLQEEQFLNFEIPLPSLPEQEAIVNNYYSKIKEAEELEKQANDLEGEIERYLFDELSISQKKERTFSSKIRVVNSVEIERWGVEYLLTTGSNKFLSSSKYNNKSLNQIVEINPVTKFPKGNFEISFIPMECISDEYGEVLELRSKNITEAKGYTKFKNGDIIWARITPCMQNGKSAIVNNLENGLGCGSTEYHVIRTNNSEIYLEYIYHLLRLKPVLNIAMSYFTGSAGQQRVPKAFLEELIIPVPPYSIQKTISLEITNIKNRRKQMKNDAMQLKRLAEEEFEKEIFGQ